MDINKNNKKEQDSELNQLEQNQGKINHKTKLIVSSEIISTEEIFKAHRQIVQKYSFATSRRTAI